MPSTSPNTIGVCWRIKFPSMFLCPRWVQQPLCSLFFSSAAFTSGAILADSSAAFYPAAILADSSAAFLAASSSAAFAAASFSTVFFSVANRVSHLRSHLLGFDPHSLCMHNRIEESCSKLWVTGFIPNALIWIKLFGHASRSADS